MNPSFASIMPQAVAAWCEELGHEVHYICHTGWEDVTGPVADTDILIVGAFTRAAFTAYALSNIYRAGGAVTALGGPHARCYPEDAARHFDYVLGFTGKAQVAEMLGEAAPHRPVGRELSAPTQPRSIPSLRQRWKFVEPTLAKGGPIKIVPMIGSFGCPYTCNFCIDANVPHQPLDLTELRDDLAFLVTKIRRPLVGWHDPNFGVQFDNYLSAIEEAVPSGTVRHIAEMSLSLLTDANLARLKANGFVGMLPGIESWYDFGYKSKATRIQGEERVRQVADHVNRVLDKIPFVQTNFILGLDCDEGAEPFELTRKFLDLTPGAFPAFSLFTAYGRASPLNIELQRAGRVNAMPFHFLDSNHGMNIKPLNYEWADFFDHVAATLHYAQGRRGIWRRLKANGPGWAGLFNWARASHSGRSTYNTDLAQLLRTDRNALAFFNGETRDIPEFFMRRIRKDLGKFAEALPEEAMIYDPYAYSASEPAMAD